MDTIVEDLTEIHHSTGRCPIEHPNHYAGIRPLLLEAFHDDEVAVRDFPIPGASWNLNLFSVITGIRS